MHFKVVMKYPGLEFAFNCLYELLLGKEVMYPIKYLKMTGRNSSADGKDCYYSASTKFGTNNLSLLIDAPGAFAGKSSSAAADIIKTSSHTFRLCEAEFSVLFLTSLLFKATNIKFENIVAEIPPPHQSEIPICGVIMDDYMVAGLFQGGGGGGGLKRGSSSSSSSSSSKQGSSSSSDGVNALFLMSQMDEPVSLRLCEVLSSFPTSEYLLSTWIRELYLQNKRYGHLKAAGFSSADFDLLHIPMQLPQGIISSMNDTLKEVRKMLLFIDDNEVAVANTVPTHSELLSKFYPELAAFYAQKRPSYMSEKTQSLDELKGIYEELLFDSLKKINTYLINTTDENIEIDQVAVELLNSTDFTGWIPSSAADGHDDDDDDGLQSFFQNLSFLTSVTLNRFSLDQLRSVFYHMIASLKSSTKLQEQLLTWQSEGTLSLKANASANINLKQIIFSGLEPSMVKELLGSEVVRDLKTYLGIKVLVN